MAEKAPTPREITLEEIAEHNSEESCWIAVNGKVYDVTRFLENHPGGPETILEVAGKDATEEFEDVGHSKAARKDLEDYLIGDLKGGVKPSAAPTTSASGEKEASSFSFLLPGVVLVGAVVYRFWPEISAMLA
eukprot:TRINITY_DN100971_c0_g1_i1.p1 TRINITY_DN100971_c0_g1~~TRINITY_DN100971_c0_g1_i1.p1  ORF type:complete len:151 (+),score=25.77 TRINITY_DN100971_c0_g1_i1:56-454(+)